MSYTPFSYYNSSSKVIAEAGAIRLVPEEISSAHCNRILLLTSKSLTETEYYRKLDAKLSEKIVQRCHKIPNHSSESLVESLVRAASELDVDGIVAFGGGSVSDTAKAIAIGLAEGLPLRRHASSFTPPEQFMSPFLAQPKLPIFSIPVSASAAEVTPGLGIRSEATEHKLLFWDMKLCPRVIFLDPELNLSIPAQIMQETMMNALAHCVEGMYSRVKNNISQGLAIEGAHLIVAAMRNIGRNSDDENFRMQALIGSHISGMVISNSRVGIHHAICHCLGSIGGLTHGEANAIILPHAMRFNATVATDELSRIALSITRSNTLSRSEATPEIAIREVEELQKDCGVPRRLRDTSLARNRLQDIAEATLRDRGLYFNPRPVTNREEILSILENAW